MFALRLHVGAGLAAALLLLRARAFASDRALLDVARDVLAGRLSIPPKEGGEDDGTPHP